MNKMTDDCIDKAIEDKEIMNEAQATLDIKNFFMDTVDPPK